MFDKFGLLEPYRPCSQILWFGEHCLWLGDLKAAMDIVSLKVNKIKTVVSVLQSKDLKLQDFNHKIISIKDHPESNIYKYFESTYQFIDEAMKEGSVLVHCSMGISRSPTIVIAFLMKRFKFTFAKAYNLVKKKRPIICPNHGFILQLKEYEKSTIELKPLPELSFRIINYPINHTKYQSLDVNQRQRYRAESHSIPLTEREQLRNSKLKRQYLPSINFVSFNMLKDLEFK